MNELEKKAIIYKNIRIKDLKDNKQYLINNIIVTSIYSQDTVNSYKKYYKNNGKYSYKDFKITKEVHFKSYEALNLYENMLKCDFDFIKKTGGSYTLDKRINCLLDFFSMSKKEMETVKFIMKGVAIYYKRELQFVVNAEGYNYSRYIGLIDQSKIFKNN